MAQTVVRLWLFPLTSWDTPCTVVTCTAPVGSVCGEVGCMSRQAGGRRNVLELTLPDDMTPVYGPVRHSLHVGLRIPALAPQRWGADVEGPDGAPADYAATTGDLVFAPARSAALDVISMDVLGAPFRSDRARVAMRLVTESARAKPCSSYSSQRVMTKKLVGFGCKCVGCQFEQ